VDCVENCENYIEVAADIGTIVEHWRYDTDKGIRKYSEKNMSPCHFVYHKTQTD
jgi:hypothetical protein